jgi:uncharacterized membrane protein YfcA
MNPIAELFIVLAVVTAVYLWIWARSIAAVRRITERRKVPATDTRFPTPLHIAVGFVTNFFDTLGIGAYAPTTSIFKLRKLVDDRLIPGTLSVGFALTSILQTYIFVSLIPVDPKTLYLMIAAAAVGAWLGAGIVAQLPKRSIQIGMGIALTVAATLMLLTQLGRIPGGGLEIGVAGFALAFAVAVNFVLGALMTVGIGMYAPSMIMVSLLGMNPKAAFPIMMGSCAFLIPIAAVQFIRAGRYDLRAAIGLTLGGIPAVLIAAFLVKQIPLEYVRWLVILVVLYAAVSMLRSAASPNPAKAARQEMR